MSDQASPVSPAIARAARRLAASSREDGLDLEDAIRVLRAVW
nr:hypothetical protein [Brachybacterium faecium]